MSLSPLCLPFHSFQLPCHKKSIRQVKRKLMRALRKTRLKALDQTFWWFSQKADRIRVMKKSETRPNQSKLYDCQRECLWNENSKSVKCIVYRKMCAKVGLRYTLRVAEVVGPPPLSYTLHGAPQYLYHWKPVCVGTETKRNQDLVDGLALGGRY